MTENKLADIAAWLDAHPGGAILDARSPVAFAAVHLRGAVSMPGVDMAAAEPTRLESELPSIHLPPRHRPLLVVASSPARAEALAVALAARGRSRVSAAAIDDSILARLPDRLLERGASDRTLWEAPRWLTAHADCLPPPALGPALDLGCGSGRAAVWLASRGYRVAGLDRQPEALALMARLAASRGVQVEAVMADLRDLASIPRGACGVVVNVRCLHRPLLAALHECVTPGGVAIIRAFRDAPGLSTDVGPAHLLEPSELVRSLAPDQWELLSHAEDHDDDGRPAAGVVARRRGGPCRPGQPI